MKNRIHEQFEAYRDKRNAQLEAEGHKPGSKWHITVAHFPTWEASRESVVVELPSEIGDSVRECRAAIEAQGLKVRLP